MKNFWKRTISLVLAVMMAFGTMPATVLAIELETVSEELLQEEEFAENPAEEQPEEEPKPDFGTISLEPENTEPLWSEAEPLAENQWSGKSAVFVGDSITAGVGTTKLYYEYLDEALDFGSVTAMGVSGSCMSTASDYGTKNQPLITRYQNIPSADLIMIFMGTNDYGHETPLGTEEDTGDGTFYGALNVIVPALVEKHTASKIVFVTSLHRYGFGTSGILGTKFTYDNIPNGVGASLGDYVDALKTVCAKNGVSVIDLFTEYPLDPTDADVREEYIPDGVHPNAAGHEVIAEIMESHIREYEPIAKEAENYRWEVKNDTLESVGEDKNNLSILAGSVTNGKLNSVHASLSKVIKLYHNRPWTVEWKASGNWSGFLFSENSNNAAKGNRYLYKSYMSGALIALGEYDGEKHQNYGIDAEEHKIDFSGEHIYRVENRINPDGSNMAYLIVDGIEKGAMDGHYVNGSGDQNSDVNWVSGKDYSFSYIGTAKYPVKDGVFEYIAVWENGKPEDEEITELIHGNKFAALGNENRASTRINYYLKAGTVITFKETETFQWACAKTSNETSTNNLGYFPEKQWTDIATATVAEDGWVGFTFKYRDETKSFDLSRPLSDFITIEEPHTHSFENGICSGCGAFEWDTDGDKTLEILAIGNSFSVDALQYAWQIANDIGIEKIVLGNLYIGGCSLETHAVNAKGDLAKYTYYHNENGTWKTTASTKISTALAERDWDYITIQQASNYSGVESTYNDDLTYLVDYVKERSDAKLGWHMTWAYQQNSTHSAFPTYNKDQMTMYNAIISAVQNKIVTNGNFDFIIPNGTAVQNSRTSLLGDTTTRDGYHMSNDYGRYLTGLAFVKTVTGLDISGVKYAPSGVDSEEKAIAIESVNNACAKPFEVTKSAYTNEIPEGYIELKPVLYKGAFWHSTFAEGYNVLHTDKSNSNQFFATPRFTKEDLPVGSIIVVESGWQYRPEGWIKDEVQTAREDVTAKSFVKVTEEWWSDYTIRAFNISKTGLPSLANTEEAEVRAAFKIYVPKEAKTVKQLVDGFDAVSSIQPGDSRLYDAHNTVSPLIFENLKLFENTAITGINLFVTGTIVDNGDTNANDPEIDDNTEYTFDISVIDSSSVKVGGKYSIKKTYTLTVKGSEIKKNDWNTFDVSHLGITVEEGETLGFGSGSSTLEIFYLGKNITSKLNYFGHNTTTGDTTLRLRTTSNLPIGVEGYSTKEPEIEDPKALKGKTLSVLGASISTYAGVSNGAAADTTNSTIRNNAKYYPNNTVKDVALNDTWWNQLASDMDLRLLVNNSWSGGAILLERAGTVGAYVDRCVQLHDNTGENAGEEPDIIVIQKGFNDFSYGKSTLGAGQVIDYDALILENGYGTPKTTMEATVIMLDKITKRYPNAEIYMFTHFKRVGQSSSDTALMEKLNKSIEEVCEKFGVNVVDLYSVLGSVEFVGDGSLHPNRLGMDVMTEAVKRSLVTNTAYEVETHLVSFELDGVTADYGDDKIVVSGKSFSANLASERDMLEVSVTMDGRDITSSAYKNGRVDIESVTGDVVINAKSTHEPQNYRWEFNGTDLAAVTGENTLTKNAGTTTNGVFDKTRYALEKSVYLLHDEPWTVEWKSEGTFMNTNGSTGARIFTTTDVNAEYNARYIFKSASDWLIAMGEKTTTGSHNYGIALADYGIDGSAPHTYRLENRIAADGSNMVWLYVDGKEIGSLTNYYVGTTDKNTTSDWLSGKDFVFPYMGTDSHGFTNAKIDYIAVWEAGKPEISDFTGKTISILGDSISTYAGISNNTAYNSTIGKNAVYYSEGDLGGFEQTWWQQAIDALGMELCVNNSWSGSTVLHTRGGTVGAYVDRAVQLHNDKTGETPDVIAVFMGTNDYSYYQSKLGTADIDYSVLIKENADGSFAYANPTNTCEAYAIMLHKMVNRYPDAEIYCMGLLPRRNPDYDGKDVVPAPTEFNAQLKKVIEHFGCIYVDIESPISAEGAEFDKYIGDKRVHPNAAGMDKMTEALLSTMLGEKTAIYGIEYDMQNANPDTSAAAVIGGKEFFANISAAKDCNNLSVTVTMGGKDITAEVCKDGKISISSVTGDIVISAVAERPAKDFRWEFDGTNLVSVSADENKLTKLGGTTENGILKNTYYSLEEAVMLYHNKEWTVEFKASGSWSGMLFSSEKSSAADGNVYMFKTTTTSGLVAFGERYSSQYHNYGVPLTAIGVDTTKEHTYRIENRVAPDGTNMAYLFVDGTEYGAMNEYYINGSENQNKKIDWISGKDFVFSYIGAASHTINNCELDYIAVWENAEKSQPISMQYDDRMDISGKTVKIVDSGESVVAVEENYLRATGVGTAKVRIDGVLYAVTVEKAKINIVTIMGQSNAGNHFANATSDVVCPPGTAYWWKNCATAPVDYTEPSMGFHTPLLAELYAQSVANGDPVKNVMVWQEGVTSKNGQSIVKWAETETDTSGTDGTAAMLKNCIAYYEQNSDKFEIVNSGIYWLQGESDVSMAPEKYTKLYMAMWNKLKEAGAEYVAFFRVRKGTNLNTAEHEDLDYTGSLTAQLDMINRNPDMFMATTITENWTGIETTKYSVNIRNYITLMAEYGKDGSYNDSYGNAATVESGILATTMKTLYGSNNKCHYGKFGYGIIGADAAYNMSKAFSASDFAIVKTDTSGKASAQLISKPGEKVTLDITGLEENLAFRASCGSTAGTLSIKVESGSEDITEKVIATGINTFGTVDTEILREYDDAVITVTYNPVSGTSGSVVYSIVDNSPEPPKMYFWDFEKDLNARDENGEVVNSFGETALNGSYVLENGMLKGNALQLALEKQIKLREDENWSVEWKFGEVTESTTGFLLCNTAKSAVGTKAVYFSFVGRVMISDYKNSKGYYNYFTDDAAFASKDTFRITNTYDSENGRSVLSLWKNGKIIIPDMQNEGTINSSSSGTQDMSAYPLLGDFVFSYLGCTGLQYFPVTGEIDYIRIVMEEEEIQPLSMQYDDRMDISGKTVEIVDAGKPTSYKVGYGVEENAVLDDAVITIDGDKLIATGIGTAKVRIDGVLYEVTVEVAPISLLLLIGQSNMRGSEGSANQSIVCPEGMVYATYGDDRGEDNTAFTVSNAAQFAASALAGEYSTINTVGTTACLSGYPLYTLTEAGAGKIGPDSGFAYEWVKQTGEKVWIVNASHGGTSINAWQNGGKEFEECEALFKACSETLRKEIAAGHFSLSHMAYFWCQGCSDAGNTAEQYVKKYLSMHESLKSVLAFDHDSNEATEDYTFEFGGIIPVRAGNAASVCYREGVYTDTTTAKYHESFKDLRFTGPRVAQYWMINNPELTDIWGVCNIGEDWVWMPDGTNGVSDYFNAHYENGTVDYTTQVAQKAAWYKPTTPAAVHDSIHYNQIGYNEIGRESVRNALIMLGEIEAPQVETEVKFIGWNGYTEIPEIPASTAGNSATLAVPMVYPIWNAKKITYELTEGLEYNYYDVIAKTAEITGELKAVETDAKSVKIVKAQPGAHYAAHLSTLPEKICCGLNLWNVLEHDDYYFANGANWAVYSGGTVKSVTIPVEPGDKIFATSFGKAGENGHASTSGIRTTFFSAYGMAKTMTPAECYAEFTANGGYLIAPEGATAINIAMWNNSDENELYILNREHDTSTEICSVCGKSSHTHNWSDWKMAAVPEKGEPVTEERTCSGCGETETREVESVWQKYNLAAHYSDLPEEICCGLNLWNVLEHDDEFITYGTHWAVHSTGKVYSVTFAVNGGDKIYSTSFGKAEENGGSSNGIRMTFLNAYGMLKTLDPAGTYAEFTENGYITAPEGAIAVNIPMWNNSDENELYILNREHDYKGIACTICGIEHPNAANYEGKVISVLGDSISTFAGYIPTADGFNLEHLARYPQDNLLTDVNETWWMQVINKLDAKLGINDSWRGSTVSGYPSVTTGVAGYLAAMSNPTQLQNLGSNGTPDVILFYGGTNDYAHTPKLGSFDPANAPTEAEFITLKWDNLAEAYCQTLLRLEYFYPDSEIICLLPTYTKSYYSNDKLAQGNAMLADICRHYGVKYVDLRECGISVSDLPDGIHPDANGMDYITEAVLKVLAECEVEHGENTVYSITHNLTGAKAEKHYYKGVSAGRAFEETVTGDNVFVTVTMGGKDITAEVYKDGKIKISSVTGDIVVTAKGKFNCDGHLQELPEDYYGKNLWKILEHDEEYYTASGWGKHSSGIVHSVTFAVTEGEKIYASSFEKSGVNGTTATDGIRVTFFDENGVLESVSADKIYAEFAENGYITVPKNAKYVNIPMWTDSADWELYVYDASYEPEFSLGEHLQSLPEKLCAGTNLWTALEPENEYYTGSAWGNVSGNGVYSVTISLESKDKIFATSFKKSGENGGSRNGIRVTWFNENGVLESVGPDAVYAEFTANGYITAPEGATAVNIPMWNNSAENELYILNREHDYKGIICTICGIEHPNAANYEGKVISVLSASTSTFAGYIPTADGFNLEHRARYPQDNLLTDVNETWWMQVINELDAKLGINESWAGSQVLNTQDNNSGDLGPDAAMASITRIKNIGANGTPDVIFFFGGGNDMGRGVTAGTFDPAAAPTEVDLTSKKWNSFADAYVAAIMRLQHFYPDSQIIVMTTYAMPSYVTAAKLDKYGPIIKSVCEHYGVEYISLRDCGVTFDMLPDGIHPNAEGMDYITEAVLEGLTQKGTAEAGENTVCSVTHNLENAQAEKHYYKGVSAGKTFEETVTGDNVSVTVTMGGKDVTADVYKDGKISISSVTGDIVVTAKGKFNCDGHLQELPEELCAGTNLWTALEPENIYYTATGWGNLAAGTSWSITFPVTEGERIYATAFGAYPGNGSTANGTRITWFDENGVLESVARDVVYKEFAANGYITVPQGATAVNVPHSSNNSEFEVYLLDREHSFGEWEITTQPTPDSNGIEQRSCSACGYSESQEFEGVWQKYNLAAHLIELPEYVCCDLNLWSVLPHEDVHLTSGKTWGKASVPVYSITVPLNEGDRIYATSFLAAGDNGGPHNGIRLTFFDAYGIAWTLDPGVAYNQWKKNGGYIEAPKGTIAVNIPLWGDNEDDEVFILNREHTYGNVTVEPNCTEEGYSGYICLACKKGEKTVTAALGHDKIAHNAKAPTCTEAGWNAYETCSRCDYTTYEEIPATGHSFGEWTEVKAPACDAEGQDKAVCGTCGETVYRDTRISGDENKILVSNPLPEDYYEGKTFLAIGDSLTNGTGVEKDERYHALFAQELGGTNINGGTSGATLCPGGHLPNKFEALMTANFLKNKKVDVVTIFLGINDWDNGVVNGTYQGVLKYDENATYYDLGELGTNDTTTIYGAAKMWCERILEIKATEGCEDIQFMFATPVITSYNKSVTNKRDWNQDKVNVFGYTLREYCTAIMETCAYYEIPVLDLNMYSGMYYNSPEDNNVDYFGGDGIHPGVNGHRMMADAFVEFMLEGYSYEERKVANCGHSYEAAVTEPTCTEQGYTTYRCPECHYSYVDNYTEPTGHSLGEWYLHKAPTTSETGEERRDCANCDYYESREVPAYKVGDINRDGKVNTIDANYARRYAAGLLTLDAGQKLAGDVNLDGEVNVMDSAIIRRYVVKYITSLPYTG